MVRHQYIIYWFCLQKHSLSVDEMKLGKFISFEIVASQYLKYCIKADRLYHGDGSTIADAIEIFSENWPIINHIQQKAANYSKHNKEAAKICITLAKTCVLLLSHSVDLTTQIYWHNAALECAKLLGDPREIYLSGNNLAIALTSSGRERESIKILLECKELAERLKDNVNKTKILNSLGIAHKNLGEFQKAIEFYNEKLDIIDDEVEELKTYGNFGIIYKEMKDYDKAIYYHNRRLNIAKKIKKLLLISNAYGDLGITYFNMKNAEKAITSFRKQLRLMEKHKIKDGKGRALWGLSQALHLNGERIKAIKIGKEALKISEERGDSLLEKKRNILIEWMNESS